MTDASRLDSWSSGDSYDLYMGRWSRLIAARFLDWLAVPPGLDWLEIGCGSGALSGAIVDRARPRGIIGVDQSADFVATARRKVTDERAKFMVADAQNLDLPDACVDVVVSALVLNFIPDQNRALREMARVARSGGTVAFYVWDYPGRGVEFMRVFWQAAVSLFPDAAEFTEDRRFPGCTPKGLEALLSQNGYSDVRSTSLEASAVFSSFEDLWRPFTLGAGPAPAYCGSLEPKKRDRLRKTLEANLNPQTDGSIPMSLRAWGLRAAVPR